MPSRKATGEPLRRIKHALALWQWKGYVRWTDKEHVRSWMAKNLDQTRYTDRELGRLMHEFVAHGGAVTEQDNPSGHAFEMDLFYYTLLPLDGQELYVEFVLSPDEEDDPGIMIVSVHWPSK